jgi:hypothetical protein
MDYGTGHETSLALFLLCLSLIGFFLPEDESDLVLILFNKYITLCFRLQDTYNLEPAGSHGVWGLDDYVFLGYIFGSSQLRGKIFFSASFTFFQYHPQTNLMHTQRASSRLLLSHPQTCTISTSTASTRSKLVLSGSTAHSCMGLLLVLGIPIFVLYFSGQLDFSVVLRSWAKVNSGLIKMYEVQ